MVGCWVGSSLIRFVVGASTSLPACCQSTFLHGKWLKFGWNCADSTVPAASPAVLLTSSTELIVAPKSRHAPPPASSKTHDLSSSHSTPSAPTSAAAAEWEHARRRLLRLLPLSLAPPEAAPSTDSAPHHDQHESVYVCPSLARVVKKAFPSGSGRFTVAHHARPTGKGSATIDAPPSGESSGSSGPSGAEGSGSNAGAASAGATAQEQILAEVRVVESAKVPAGHVWMSEALRREVGIKKGDGACELLRCVGLLRSPQVTTVTDGLPTKPDSARHCPLPLARPVKRSARKTRTPLLPRPPHPASPPPNLLPPPLRPPSRASTSLSPSSARTSSTLSRRDSFRALRRGVARRAHRECW